MGEPLKPCPFCGEAEELYPSHDWPGSGPPHAIDCLGCGFDFVPRKGKDVIAAWNRRAPPPAAGERGVPSELITETTETQAPNFDQRITDAVYELDCMIGGLTNNEDCPRHLAELATSTLGRLYTLAAVCRDYARTDLTAEAQSLGMYDVTDGHEDDPINQGGK